MKATFWLLGLLVGIFISKAYEISFRDPNSGMAAVAVIGTLFVIIFTAALLTFDWEDYKRDK